MIPLNGRIAIVDDKIEQALPLMRVLAKNNIPYTYYKGSDPEYLPDSPCNDIRILFLDLNLLDGRDNQPKDIKSTLYSTIHRIISPQNFPYVVILWSRQEKEYKETIECLFKEELKDLAPIIVLNWIKSDFFPNFAENEENKEKEYIIFEELIKVLSTIPAYGYLMQWENCAHISADTTIKKLFRNYNSSEEWSNYANCILDMFAHSYLEKNFNDSTPEKKAKASLLFLNDVFNDTLESNVSNVHIQNATELQCEVSDESRDNIKAKINRTLLMSDQKESLNQPGCVLSYNNPTKDITTFYHKIFNDSINTKGLSTRDLKAIKNKIYVNLQPCDVVVTPACDYAQKKNEYDRIVQGVILEAEFQQYINKSSEAIYISPIFEYDSRKSIIVLNFRYFKTDKLRDEDEKLFLFRMRTSLLSEIQSKLSRHINRQGIMNL